MWPPDPWPDDEGSLTASLFVAVPTAAAGLLEVEAETAAPLEAAALAVVLRPCLEGLEG